MGIRLSDPAARSSLTTVCDKTAGADPERTADRTAAFDDTSNLISGGCPKARSRQMRVPDPFSRVISAVVDRSIGDGDVVELCHGVIGCAHHDELVVGNHTVMDSGAKFWGFDKSEVPLASVEASDYF